MSDNSVELDLMLRPAADGAALAELRVVTPRSAAPITLPEPVLIRLPSRGELVALALDPAAYGRALTGRLFAGPELRQTFAQARAVAQQNNLPLQLRLVIAPDAPALHALRWETLRDPDNPDLLLAALPQIWLSRYLGCASWGPVGRRTPGELRTLALVAAPADLDTYGLSPIDVRHATALLQAALVGTTVTLLGGERRATLDALAQELANDYDLLVLLAHGRQDESGATLLYLEDAQGQTAPVAGAELIARIAALTLRPRMVVLAACHSGGDGLASPLPALGPQLVAAGVPAVLATQARLSQETAWRFLPTLLGELARDGQIDRAVALARSCVCDRSDAWMSALYLRLTDGQLWDQPTCRCPAAHSPHHPASALRQSGGIHFGSSTAIGSIGTVQQTTVLSVAAPAPAALHQLRPSLRDFVGRTSEIARLIEALRAGVDRLSCATICGVRGMGGIGKTALAELVAHRLAGDFPDAQLMVDLRGSTATPLAPEQALRLLISAFQPAQQLPDDLPALQARYRSLLHGRRVLILADDACDAAQVRPLLPAVGCALLVTSRQRFALDGMAMLDLDCLPLDESARMLRSVCARLTDTQAHRLAALCGHLPLALRISAGILANDEALPAERYLALLADEHRRLDLLRDPDDTQRSVAAILMLSYTRLDPQAQAAFRGLGVLADQTETALVAAVLELPEEAADATLRQLLRRCLVEYSPAQGRWRIHALVRDCALALLIGSGEERAARLRYARRVVGQAEQAKRLFFTGGEGIAVALARFDRERSHHEAVRAWLWAQPSAEDIDALLIADADASVYLGEPRNPVRSVRLPQWERALEAARRQGDRRAEIRALGNLGHALRALGAARAALPYYQQGLALARTIGDRYAEAQALGSLGNARFALGELRTALDFYRKDLAIARVIGGQRNKGRTLNNLGRVYAALGEPRRAIACYTQCLSIARALGAQRAESITLGNLGRAYAALGEMRQAADFYEQDLRIVRSLGDRYGEGIVLGHLGNALTTLDGPQAALPYLQQCLITAYEVGDMRMEGWALKSLSNIALLLGNATQALRFAEEALAASHRIGDRHQEGVALHALGLAQATLGRPDETDTSYTQSRALLDAIGAHADAARAAWDHGLFLVAQGRTEPGLALLAECIAHERRIGHALAEEHAALAEALAQGT